MLLIFIGAVILQLQMMMGKHNEFISNYISCLK